MNKNLCLRERNTTLRTVHMCVQLYNRRTEHSTEQLWYLPFYPRTNIIAQMLSTGGGDRSYVN